jgi:Holliday junction resolvase RusA-like endonuclease
MGAVRMTQSDKWKTNPNHPDPEKRQRDRVRRYFEFKNKVVQECNRTGYQMNGIVDVVFCIPMPDSWSNKKKAKMNGLPHKVRPDIDNILKGLMDTLKKEDGDIWRLKNVEKRYAYKGSIIIFE